MPEVKVIEQTLIYFTHEEVEALLFAEGGYYYGSPRPYDTKRISAGLGVDSGLTLCLQREVKEEKDAKG